MQNILIFLTYGSAIVYILTSVVLFANCKKGDRSRIILASLQLFSGVMFTLHFILQFIGETPSQAISIHTIIITFIGIMIYLMYSIEVISPRWLNLKRITILFIPTLVIIGIYLISCWAGVKYLYYDSFAEMLPNITHFEVWFRLSLCLLLFTPVLYIFFVPYTKKYNNTNFVWMRTYTILITINIFSYISGILFYNFIFDLIFYYTASIARLIIVYIELFIRLDSRYISNDMPKRINIKNNLTEAISININSDKIKEDNPVTHIENVNNLFQRMEKYMQENAAWRDPSMSMTYIVDILKTNRTTLAQIMRKNGQESFTTYVNKLRVDDFIQIVKSNIGVPFQETFYDVGFRSRTTALRSFRRVTETTPSEYFKIQY